MDNIYVDIRGENNYVTSNFSTDLVSVNELLNVIESLTYTVEQLEEKINDFENTSVEAEFDPYSEYGLNESDFH